MQSKQRHAPTARASVPPATTMSIAACTVETPQAAARQIVAAVISIALESRFVVRAFCFHGHELIVFDNVGGEVVAIDTAGV
jgi:hypothetical protein